MKLPLIGLQTNPSGTASSPSSRPPSHPNTALSFRPWTTSVDNLVSKGLITSIYTPPTLSPHVHSPTASDELPTEAPDGILTHPTGLSRGQSLPSALGVIRMDVSEHRRVKRSALGSSPWVCFSRKLS